MMAVFLGNGTTFGVFAGSIPRLREAAHLSDGHLGLTLLAVSAGAAIAMPITGRLAPRAGPARLCLAGGLAVGVTLPLATLVVALGGAWPLLLAAMAALGLSLGTMDVAMNARGSEVELAWGAPIMSSFHAVWSIGGLAGSALAALSAALQWSLLAAWTIAGCWIGLLATAALALRRGQGNAPKARSRFMLPGRALAALCAIAAVCFTLEGAVADWIGVYLRTTLAASEPMASAAYSAFAFAMVCGRLGGDAVVRRFGPVLTQRAGGLLAAVGTAAGLAVSDPVLAAACFALVGLGVANVVPLMFSAAGRQGGASGIAMSATSGYFGLMAGPPVIGFLAQATSVGTALGLVLAGALALVALAPAVRLRDART
jgi:MFS family permease